MRAATLAIAVLAACGPGNPGGPGFDRTDDLSPLESADILGRSDTHERVHVKHVLIGWGALEANYGGRMSDEARARSRLEAERLVRRIVAELEGGTPIEVLMIDHSGDRGTADGRAIAVEPGSKLAPEFEALSLRLAVGERGVVRTPFGYHVIERVK